MLMYMGTRSVNINVYGARSVNVNVYGDKMSLRGLLEKYPTFGREKETGLLGTLDT